MTSSQSQVDWAADVARLGSQTLENLTEDASPKAKEEALLSAMLSQKVRDQATEIQSLLDKVGKLEEAAAKASRPACTHLDKAVLPGSHNLLFRDGLPSFKEHNELVKQIAQLSKEYRQVKKQLSVSHPPYVKSVLLPTISR
jgi:hypothetical protein